MNRAGTHPFVPRHAERDFSRADAAYARLRKLTRMPLSEIAGRTRQEAAKLIDRVTAAGTRDARKLLERQAPLLANPQSALQVLRESAPQRFFAGAEQPSWIGERLPAHRYAVLNSAASSMQNRLNLLGYRTLWFGDPIDWHFDPVSSRRAPRRHWTRLNPLDAAAVGDNKIVWELNRHQWLVQIAQAYALTREERYAERCLRTVESWIEANPYGIGINWASTLEVAYRVMSWSWILLLLRHSKALSATRLQSLLSSLWQHATYIARYPSFYFSPNTHLTGEALGLFYAGTLFPEFGDARRWQETGACILIAESSAQICRDGVHFERSTCYHRYTVETYQQFLLLAERNSVAVPACVTERLRAMTEYVMSVRCPDGFLPEIGDADGGRLLPVVERHQRDPRGILAVANAMFRRGDFAWASDGLAPDVLWLMGKQGATAFDKARPVMPALAPSRLFSSGGYAVMQSAWEGDAHQLIVDTGPLGCPVSCGHGHADLLSIQCAAFGEPVLVDAGTYCYTAEPEWRNFFRGTAAHNTLMIDGRDQVECDGPFGWRGRPAARVREWRATSDCDFIDASHDAYDGVIHRRRVLFVKPDYWVIVDDVEEKGVKRGLTPFQVFDIGFQFAPMPVSLVDARWARAETRGGNTFWIGTFTSSNSSMRPSIKIGELGPIRGWVSTDYGQRTPAPLLVYSCRAGVPWRSITLLIPQRGRSSTAPIVSVMSDDNGFPLSLELEDRRESIFVDETEIHRSLDH
jgi:Heparinase II/III-like protein/Heparinase II/III N-terminus